MGSESILEVECLTKIYPTAGGPLTVLHEVTFSVPSGSVCAIVGPSGSGKTTLLGLCAGLDVATSGSVRLAGKDVSVMGEDDRARLRADCVGFVFQSFQLLPTLTALENVMVPAELRGESGVVSRATELLDLVGLGDRRDHYPVQLSGGEQQRVALARAFVNRPGILFADEPTGNLDTDTAGRVIELLIRLNAESGTTLVLVTHDTELAMRAGRMVRLRGGRIVEDRETAGLTE